MKRYFFILAALTMVIMPFLASCSDKDDDGKTDEFANWQSRNDAYFSSIRSTSLKAIAAAKSAYSDKWMEHCDWRTYLSYSLNPSSKNNTSTDSIHVKILKRGTGTECPISTDSVRVFYAGYLIPTDLHADGMLFDHSGQSTIEENIFDHEKGMPASMLISSCTRGFATALQYMHIGDKWRIYVPYKLGYDKVASNSVPAYSTLVFDVELVQFARAGHRLPAWR